MNPFPWVSIEPTSALYLLAGIPTAVLLLYRMFARPAALAELVGQSARVFVGFVAALHILLVAMLQRIPFRLTFVDRAFFGLAGLMLGATVGYPLVRGTRMGEWLRVRLARLLGLDRMVPTNPLEPETKRLKDLQGRIGKKNTFDLDDRTDYLECHAAILTLADRCDLPGPDKERISVAAAKAAKWLDEDPLDPVNAAEGATAIGVLVSTVDATFRAIPPKRPA